MPKNKSINKAINHKIDKSINKKQKSYILLAIGASITMLFLYAITFISGTVLMALEVAGGRLLTPYFGGSVYVWGSIISVFLVALSLGYFIGGILADKYPNIKYLAVIIALSGLLTLIIPIFGPTLSKVIYSSSLMDLGSFIAALILFFFPSFGLAMVSPYVVKLGLKNSDKLGNLVGSLYAISTIGSVVGALGATFLLIPYFGVREIIYAFSAILLILSAAIYFSIRFWAKGIILLIIAVPLPLFAFNLAPLASYVKGSNIVYAHESVYNDIIVRDVGDNRYLTFDDVSYQSAMNKKNPTAHVTQYTELMVDVFKTFNSKARNVLLIGVGGGTIPKAILNESPEVSIDAVDIDSEIIDVAYKYFAMPKKENLRTFAMDGRVFLDKTHENYDVIFVDAFNRLTIIPYHLTSKEFFEKLARVSADDGLVIINVIGSIRGKNSLLVKSLIKTSSQDFPDHRIFKTMNYADSELNNIILVFSKKTLPNLKLTKFQEYTKKLDLSDAIVLTDNFAPIDIIGASEKR